MAATVKPYSASHDERRIRVVLDLLDLLHACGNAMGTPV
jgi:hypothetical protein